VRTGDVDLPERAHDGSSRIDGLTPESGLHRVGGVEGERGQQQGAAGQGVVEEDELTSTSSVAAAAAAAAGPGSSLPVPAQHRGSGRAEEAHRTVQGDRLSLRDRGRAADDGGLGTSCWEWRRATCYHSTESNKKRKFPFICYITCSCNCM